MAHVNEPTSYRTTQDADFYFESQLYATDWTGATQDDKEKALLAGTRAIDSLCYQGYKHPVAALLESDPNATQEEIDAADATQLKQWPRVATLDPEEWLLTINANNGTYELLFNGEATAPIAYDATAAQITTALEALDGVAVGDVVVTVNEDGTDGVGPYDIEHLADHNNTLTANDIDLSGGGSTTKVSVITHNDNVPDEIFYAVCEEAISLLSGRRPDMEYRNQVLTSDGIGTNRVNMDRNDMNPLHTAHFITSPLAWKWLAPYLNSRNSFTITRVN